VPPDRHHQIAVNTESKGSRTFDGIRPHGFILSAMDVETSMAVPDFDELGV